MYRWEFDKGKQSLTVAVVGPLIDHDAEIQVRAALDGVGVVWTLEHYAAAFVSAGKLVRVLEDPRSQLLLVGGGEPSRDCCPSRGPHDRPFGAR